MFQLNQLNTVSILLLLCFHSHIHFTTAQIQPCGTGQCSPNWAHGSSYDCWDYPSPSITDPAELDAWINCSAILPDNWKFVQNASAQWGDAYGHITVHKMDFCDDYWYAHGVAQFSYKNWLAKNPTLAANPKCHNIVKKAMCTHQVAPYDINGKPNHYAWTGSVDYGSSMCRSVCDEFWDACGLHDDAVADAYVPLSGFSCFTPKTTLAWIKKDASIPRWPSPLRGKAACSHLNGTIQMPNCSSFMNFECKNGGIWHPECTGCLCKPGFGGADCGRCSSKVEMWPHVNRASGDYDNSNVNRSGTTFAAAACAVMSGLDPNAGPIGDGKMVDLNSSQCSEIEVLRPLPVQSSKNSTPNNVMTVGVNNHTNMNLNLSSVTDQIFDCSFDPGQSLLAGYTGAFSRVKYGIVASEECFDESEGGGGNNDPWASPDCDVRGNLSIDIIKTMRLDDLMDYEDHYSPRGIHCDFTDCEQGEYEECINNKVPKDYVEPCIKCNRIQCVQFILQNLFFFGSCFGSCFCFCFPWL